MVAKCLDGNLALVLDVVSKVDACHCAMTERELRVIAADERDLELLEHEVFQGSAASLAIVKCRVRMGSADGQRKRLVRTSDRVYIRRL